MFSFVEFITLKLHSMKLSRVILAVSMLTFIAPTVSAEAGDKTDKKTIYIINGKRAEPFEPEIADMSAFKTVGGNAAKIAKLAANAGVSEQELSENDVVILKSKKPMYIASTGQSIDYTGTVSCEGSRLPNICIMTQCGETDADGKFVRRVKYGTDFYIYAKGYKGKRFSFTADLRKKITLEPVGTPKKESGNDEKKPMYDIVNGVYVRTFDINNYEPDEIISVKHVWESTDEVCAALTKAHIKPKFAEQNGAAVITLRDGVKLGKPDTYAAYTLAVCDTDGKPVSGAKIFIKKAHTDLQGNFAMTADCGTEAIAVYRNNLLKIKRFEFGAVPAISIDLERNPQNDATDDKPFTKVDAMPRYMGGDLLTFRNWVMNYVTYPQVMQNLGIEGRVLVAFVIGRDGYIEEIEIIESPHEKFSEEVVKVLNRSKKWTPGFNAGKPVRVRFTMPVDFKINRNR